MWPSSCTYKKSENDLGLKHVKSTKRDLKRERAHQEDYNNEKIKVCTKQYRDLRSFIKVTHFFLSLLELNTYQACMIIYKYVEHVENNAIKLLQLSQLIWLYYWQHMFHYYEYEKID